MPHERSPSEEENFLRLLEQSALNDYPNPERKGCPGLDFLRTLATDRKSVAINDPRIDHVTHCSPCFREFVEIRDRNAKRPRKFMLVGVTAIAAILIAAIWAGVFYRTAVRRSQPIIESRGNRAQADSVAQLDFRWAPTRGDDDSTKRSPIPKLKRKRTALTVLLPFTTGEGKHEVELTKDIDSPIVMSSGDARITNGITTLTVILDLTRVPPGRYLIGVRGTSIDLPFQPVVVE